MKCPWYYQEVECTECHSIEDCNEWPYRKAPTMDETVTSPNKGFDYVQDDDFHITASDMVAHMRRVETLCTLLENMLKALAGNPMFAAMVPPHIQQQLKDI